jgi:GTP-binding protein
MLPVIALVGRPNVGKSTLFNCLTKSRDALVADMPGVTRDRHYGTGQIDDKSYIVIDTGGIGENQHDIDEHMTAQSKQAMVEASEIIFVVDGRTGPTNADLQIAQQLRELGKPIFLAVNKVDGTDEYVTTSDFYGLGLGTPHAIAAAQGRGVTQLIQAVAADFPSSLSSDAISPEDDKEIKIAIIGKPNVGKSTLVNRILGEERVIVFDMPGTTRDSIEIPLERLGQKYTLIDTAGVRRRGRITDVVEKFSVVKALQAIEHANVVIYVFDAKGGITDQDLHLLGFVIEAGRALVLAVNKWDNLDPEVKDTVKEDIERRLRFVDFAKIHFISALHGTGVGDLFKSVDIAYAAAMYPLTTSVVTTLLEAAIKNFQPPLVGGRRIKLRYANPGGHNPPTIVIHGNQAEATPNSYQRYLINFFRKELKLVGTPLNLVFRTSTNPFKPDKPTKLSPLKEHAKRQERRFAKKKDRD